MIIAHAADRFDENPLSSTGGLSSIVLVVDAGEVHRETLDGRLELGVQVDELAQPGRHPGEGDLLVTTTRLELLDATVGEVHVDLRRES